VLMVFGAGAQVFTNSVCDAAVMIEAGDTSYARLRLEDVRKWSPCRGC